MAEKAAARLKSDGWTIVETTGFLHLIGPLWTASTNMRLRPKTSTTTAAAWCRAAC